VIVVDTNVVAYFVIPGDATETAERVRTRDPIWAAPKLWRSEMRNLIVLYLRMGIFDLSSARGYMADSISLISGKEFDVDSDRILEFADASGCTAYDCEFVSLADRLAVPLVTSDRKLLAAFPGIAVSLAEFAA
jgi:predicted nucleic acid-binding protein